MQEFIAFLNRVNDIDTYIEPKIIEKLNEYINSFKED
jgi:hypothetical protein